MSSGPSAEIHLALNVSCLIPLKSETKLLEVEPVQYHRFQQIVALIVLATAAFCSGESAAQESADLSLQPYVAYVARDGEHTRCGPADSYYKTDPLKAGQEVEVYLETSDDWLGIRPPENSFCWLQSDQVQVEEDEVTGTIVDSGAYSWIGTHLGRAQKYSWQVRLDQGEEVTIIGTARRDGPDGEEFWYRIVPPPGEFRWLHRSQIVYSPDEVELTKPKPKPLPNRQLATNENRPQTKPNEQERQPSAAVNLTTEQTVKSEPISKITEDAIDLLGEDSPIGSGLAVRSRPAPPSSAEPAVAQQSAWVGENQRPLPSQGSNMAPALNNNIASVAHVDSGFENNVAPALNSVIPTGQTYRPQTELGTANVEALQLELSRAMASDATAIQIQPLRDRCAQISTGGPDAVTRGRAALLLRRIEEYQRIVIKRTGSQSSVAQVSTNVGMSSGHSSDPVATDAATGAETSFDRQGWLVKVYSARPNSPPYAVTDSAGRTLSYVTPVPGINLRRYLNQEVGLYGRVAYDTSLETPHLIAEQAVRVRR